MIVSRKVTKIVTHGKVRGEKALDELAKAFVRSVRSPVEEVGPASGYNTDQSVPSCSFKWNCMLVGQHLL